MVQNEAGLSFGYFLPSMLVFCWLGGGDLDNFDSNYNSLKEGNVDGREKCAKGKGVG